MGAEDSGLAPIDGIATSHYGAVVATIFFRVLLGTATVAATVAVTGCNPPERSVTEFSEDAFCNHVQSGGGVSMEMMESFTANPNLDDALELRRQAVESNETSQSLAPPEIEDAVSRAVAGSLDLLDLMVSTGFDPSLADAAEKESVAKSVEDSLAAADEVDLWVDANCDTTG
jgi:hypothetical protein